MKEKYNTYLNTAGMLELIGIAVSVIWKIWDWENKVPINLLLSLVVLMVLTGILCAANNHQDI